MKFKYNSIILRKYMLQDYGVYLGLYDCSV